MDKISIDQFEYCNCVSDDIIKKCGCGKEHCRMYRDTVIHWEGEHWLIECAFKDVVKTIKELQDYTRRLEEKRNNYTEV